MEHNHDHNENHVSECQHHYHEHGEHCSCGCHDHEHHHHHGHEEHSERSESKLPVISVSRHEAAVIGSVECRISGSYEIALAELQRRMSAAAESVESHGGIIGHIKFFARDDSRGCMLSLTEPGEVQMKSVVQEGILAEGAVIVFGITSNDLDALLHSVFR